MLSGIGLDLVLSLLHDVVFGQALVYVLVLMLPESSFLVKVFVLAFVIVLVLFVVMVRASVRVRVRVRVRVS